MPASARRDAARMMSGRGRSVDVGVPAWVVAVAAVGAGFVLRAAHRDGVAGRLGRVRSAHHVGVVARCALAEPSDIPRRHRDLRDRRRADGRRPRAHRVLGAEGAPLTGAASPRASAGRGRHRTALHVRTARPPRADVRGGRRDDRVLDHGRRARADLRGAPVPRPEPRGRAPHGRDAVRGGGGDLGSAPDHRPSPGHAPARRYPHWSRAPCSRSPGPSASSARPSPSRGASRASLAPSRSRCTSSERRTPTRRWRCRSSSSSWPWSWSRSAHQAGEPGGLRWRSAP